MSISAVTTTGIYCRPGCVARPRPEHVEAYAAPVAAEAAGYRPCLRCRPDQHLRAVEVNGAPAAVQRAVVLISEGHLDRFDETALAAHVGYSARQLRRLFLDHVGASPDFVARSRRAHFARRLLDDSDLPMGAIAAASGFGSSRQMNRVVTSIFGFSPTALRARRSPSTRPQLDGGLQLRLRSIDPLDRGAALAHLAPRVTPGVESIDGAVYRRTISLCGHPGVIEVDLGAADDDHVLLIRAHLPAYDALIDEVARVRRMFGLDEAHDGARARLAADPMLAPMVDTAPHQRVIGGWDRFETAVRVVLGQQISVAAATTQAAQLVARFGRPVDPPVGGLDRLFPEPEDLRSLDRVADPGMPRRRAATIAALARAVLDGTVDPYQRCGETLRRTLCAIDGIGPWTAEMVAMRSLRDPDAFPASDLGLRHAVARARTGSTDALPSEAEMAELAEGWRPHRALAAQYLWNSLNRTEAMT